MMITKKLKKRLSTVLMLSTIILPVLVSSGAPAYASFENGSKSSDCDSNSSSDGSSGSSSDSSNATQASGGVNIDGMGFVSQDKLNNAKSIAKWINDNLGFGEDQLGVILAIAFKESGWRLDAWNAGGQVGGFFQWSGNAAVNGDRLAAAGVAEDHKQHMTLDDTYKVLNYEIKEGHSASATIMNGLMRDAGNDPSKVNYAWGNKYEGLGGGNEDQMHSDSIMARYKGIAKAIGADSMKINQDKINALPTSTASGSGANTAASSDGATTSTSTSTCDTGSSSTDSADGTGSISEKGTWKKDDVPADVKQYIHDPTKIGLAYHGANGWLAGITSEHNNCTDFSESYFDKIWGLNMSSGLIANGAQVVDGMATKFGGSSSNTPHAGDVFSTPSNAPGSGGYGHTGIVEHVLSSGDIIISEQNVTGYSGDLNGGAEEWNYRVVDKDKYQSGQWTFYHPEGKTANWG